MQNANWTHLYTLNDADAAFNYFITKLKEYTINVFLSSHKLLNINRTHG